MSTNAKITTTNISITKLNLYPKTFLLLFLFASISLITYEVQYSTSNPTINMKCPHEGLGCGYTDGVAIFSCSP
jgi:hypothetical protein